VLLVVLCATRLSAQPEVPTQTLLPTLTNVIQIRNMTQQEAAAGRPVEVKGVITYYNNGDLLFVQDSTGGIYIWSGNIANSRWHETDVKRGDFVKVTGVTLPGAGQAQVIAAMEIKLLGQGSMPEAKQVSVSRLATGEEDGQWVEIEGIVRSADAIGGQLMLHIANEGKRVATTIWIGQGTAPPYLYSKVRVRGVCAAQFDKGKQLTGVSVLVPDLSQIWVTVASPPEESLAVQTIDSLTSHAAGPVSGHRVRIQGTVTLQRDEKTLFIQDATGGLCVQLQRALSAESGDRLEILGFPRMEKTARVLEDATATSLGRGTRPVPLAATAEQIRFGHFDASLVKLQGRILDQDPDSLEQGLFLQSGHFFFTATPAQPSSADVLRGFAKGSLVEVTGVCQTGVNGSGDLSFQLLVASPAGVRVLEKPSWWTVRLTLGGLGTVLLVALAWVGSLRGQVRRRTRELREQIAERMQTEEAFRESQSLYLSLVEHLPVNVYRKDREGRYLFANSRFCQYQGTTADQILGKTVFDLASKELAEQFDAQDQIVMETGKPLEVDELRQDLDNRTLYFHLIKSPVFSSDGKIVGTQGMFHDITARKQAQAELAYERDLLRTLLEKSPDYIYFKDLNSRFLRCSQTLVENCGLKSMDEIVGKCDADFFAEEHARPPFEDEQEIIRTGQPIVGKVEKKPWKNGGKVTWVLTTKVPLRDEAGEIVGTFGISKDITVIKEGEARLEAAHKELLQASRRAGMAEVASSVLHNVGNVLNSVNVSATLVAENLRKSKSTNLARVVALLQEHSADLGTFITLDPKGKQLPGYLAQLSDHLGAEQEAIIKEMHLLRNNIEHIKDIVTMQQSHAKVSGVVGVVKVTDLVEDALRMNGGSPTRHEVQIVREYGSYPPEITVDKHKVLQILVNLIRNAKYACDECDRSDKRLTLRLNNRNDQVRIEVTDNGVGISPENLTRIFAHGFTTKKDGHGFGLHSAALAAKEMGGSLRVHSDGAGRGATFTLELPCNPPGTVTFSVASAGTNVHEIHANA
jgi:PAS domain S-box-containing protein